MPFTSALWTGRLELEVVDEYDSRIGTLEFSIRIDIVTIWWGNRTLSVIDREQFRNWLLHPTPALTIDDLTWTVLAGSILLRIDNHPGYLIPDGFLRRVLEVI